MCVVKLEDAANKRFKMRRGENLAYAVPARRQPAKESKRREPINRREDITDYIRLGTPARFAELQQ